MKQINAASTGAADLVVLYMASSHVEKKKIHVEGL